MHATETKAANPPDALSFSAEDFANSLGVGSRRVKCNNDRGVIHLFKDSAITSKNDPLNFVFRAFNIPDTADVFIQSFRTHLKEEVFRPAAKGWSGSDGGGSPGDANRFPLLQEHLTAVDARTVLLRVASEAPMVFAVEIVADPEKTGQAAWDVSSATLLFKALR